MLLEKTIRDMLEIHEKMLQWHTERHQKALEDMRNDLGFDTAMINHYKARIDLMKLILEI